ncbi:uncharacterized protein MELLADRAFT_107345 [Melampsora larici-populina 98AG31]|uniref:C2H2-type domain-containing protein n=1 Tax=Melampsora larici-populina (strain 98AG31 / pathotype 3-4-7) TaxID=747676 RepID=F4RPH3_MELLP|nr:uncharacterized protein MELLADRAFT_107345 [Melampsora larici-populina 98AG31]EGG05720.1 hypothetical protein MELLADRAFT_107345 [Melampsora larici-populina 98AG31]
MDKARMAHKPLLFHIPPHQSRIGQFNTNLVSSTASHNAPIDYAHSHHVTGVTRNNPYGPSQIQSQGSLYPYQPYMPQPNPEPSSLSFMDRQNTTSSYPNLITCKSPLKSQESQSLQIMQSGIKSEGPSSSSQSLAAGSLRDRATYPSGGSTIPKEAACRIGDPRDSFRRGPKIYVCSFCSKCFDRPSTLATHQLTHTGEKPHTCKKCGKSFSVASNLRRHEQSLHGPKPKVGVSEPLTAAAPPRDGIVGSTSSSVIYQRGYEVYENLLPSPQLTTSFDSKIMTPRETTKHSEENFHY